jgi:hypothetical protein
MRVGVLEGGSRAFGDSLFRIRVAGRQLELYRGLEKSTTVSNGNTKRDPIRIMGPYLRIPRS